MTAARDERFEGLFKANYSAVRAYPLRRTSGDAAQDVVAETFLVQVSPNGDRIDLFTRYLVYARLPLDSSGVAKLDLDPHPGAKCALGAGETMGAERSASRIPAPAEPRRREAPPTAGLL